MYVDLIYILLLLLIDNSAKHRILGWKLFSLRNSTLCSTVFCTWIYCSESLCFLISLISYVTSRSSSPSLFLGFSVYPRILEFPNACDIFVTLIHCASPWVALFNLETRVQPVPWRQNTFSLIISFCLFPL